MRPGDVTLPSLLSDKLGFSQKLAQAVRDGERSHCPGLGDQDGESRRCSGQMHRGCHFGNSVSRRAVSPRNNVTVIIISRATH